MISKKCTIEARSELLPRWPLSLWACSRWSDQSDRRDDFAIVAAASPLICVKPRPHETQRYVSSLCSTQMETIHEPGYQKAHCCRFDVPGCNAVFIPLVSAERRLAIDRESRGAGRPPPHTRERRGRRAPPLSAR